MLKHAKELATIFSLIAIPVIGWWIQDRIATEGVRKDYVAMATDILREAPTPHTMNLRDWAISIVDTYSPVPLTPAAKDELRCATWDSVARWDSGTTYCD